MRQRSRSCSMSGGGGGGEKHLFACAGMGEAEGAGVERLSRACRETVVYKLPVRCRRGAAQYLVTAISGIIEKRMADVAHVDAYLMGASGLKHTFYQRYMAKCLQHLVMGHGMLAQLRVGGVDGHLEPVFQRPAYVPLDAAGGGEGMPQTSARYSRLVVLLKNCLPRWVFASGVLATTSRPEVSLSMRCTSPSRGSFTS